MYQQTNQDIVREGNIVSNIHLKVVLIFLPAMLLAFLTFELINVSFRLYCCA